MIDLQDIAFQELKNNGFNKIKLELVMIVHIAKKINIFHLEEMEKTRDE